MCMHDPMLTLQPSRLRLADNHTAVADPFLGFVSTSLVRHSMISKGLGNLCSAALARKANRLFRWHTMFHFQKVRRVCTHVHTCLYTRQCTHVSAHIYAHVSATCLCHMSLPHVSATCLYRMSLPHVSATCLCHMSLHLSLRISVQMSLFNKFIHRRISMSVHHIYTHHITPELV